MVSAKIPSGAAKVALAGSHFMVWVSSTIVVGITGYFLNDYAHDSHLIFEMVISALVLSFWLPSFVLPFTKFYQFFYLPLNFIFSYLWLTGFIFSAQDYNKGNCNLNAPFFGHCSLKLANESFLFLGFFFTLVAFVVDTLAWKAAATAAAAPVHPEKDVRPSAETAA
ncbi:might be a transmembrane protein [Lophiotrema nucula]|uniref:Might be a transmembrane protein n=1 Tax=Lophiotrema nucula TaxID=690887 RepID=A0A6A5ZAA6_9PLEO|nr:might be a transmembrane protein [Lophiotrema nucula]